MSTETVMEEKPKWGEIVTEIMNMPDQNWTYDRIGKAIGGVSRSFVGRLVSNPDADPPFSNGFALLKLRKQLRAGAIKPQHNGRRRAG